MELDLTPAELITCDICGRTTLDNEEENLMFGEWMRRMQLKVHYFCLLLSTNLPQRGSDTSGIMGFLVRDIRKEAAEARKRKCVYCLKPGAAIKCITCGQYFDLVCSVENHCTTQFCHQFHSYCRDCTPMDEYMQQLAVKPPKDVICDICLLRISKFGPHHIVYPECCRLGFVHRVCMRRYAFSSGYYLTCMWCRSNKFRETIRMQGIFVPDRDAVWERQKNAYRELHMRILRCDEKECLCSKGRNYNQNAWCINACQVCGSTGAHARCLAHSMHLRMGMEPMKFTCNGCKEVEKKLKSKVRTPIAKNKGDQVDTSFFMTKEGPKLPTSAGNTESEGPLFSDDESDLSSNESVVTVVPNSHQTTSSFIAPSNASKSSIASPPQAAAAIDLTEEDPVPEKLLALRESFNCPGEPFFYLVIYEFDEQGTCKGSCTLRFDEKDPRIQDRSEEALRRLQFRPEDVWFRNKDCGIYAIVHKYQDKPLKQLLL
ncbi:pineapple eye protein [Drosophila kikkawai]|uniref:Pineapple eye protein n=1 Tax=Drosophila kikkawai TaxID=30033 RepID=A0A6P4IGZ8_DROKI|nr:PHD finger protein 7 [Drosophila kikkawai]